MLDLKSASGAIATGAGAAAPVMVFSSYPLQLGACLFVAGLGALAFRLQQNDPIFRDAPATPDQPGRSVRRTWSRVLSSAVFGGFTTPVGHDLANLPDSWQWLLGVALVMGMSGHVLIVIVPGLMKELVQRASAFWMRMFPPAQG